MNAFENADPEQPPRRDNFVLSGNHYFIQNPSEIDTGHFRLGIEHRVAAGAFDVESYVTFEVEDAPDLMDRIADFHVLPKYTDLLDMRQRLLDLTETAVKYDERMNNQLVRDILEGK